MISSYTYFNRTTLAALFMAVVMIGCSDTSTGLAEDTVFDTPTVISTYPENNDTDTERNALIFATFSEEMDAATLDSVTFTVHQGSLPVAGTVSYSGNTATFTSTNPLSASAQYSSVISVGAKSSNGVAMESITEWSFTTGGSTTPLDVVDLGTSGNYVILAKTAITNNPTSEITGDLGISPAAGSYITGFPLTDAPGYATTPEVNGRIYAADMADPTPANLTTAVENMITAYNDAAGRPSPDFFELHTGDIGGKTLTPGLYKWTNTVIAPTNVVLSGDADDVWIFQIAEDLTVSSGVNFTLSNGAQAKNIFWQVAGEATIGTDSHFEGIILSMTGITLNTRASLNGRMLAQSAVTLDGNSVIQVD